MFNKAYKRKAKLRLLLEGASGSGKTYSALLLASGISSKIAVIDTERGSASLYADEFDFEVCELSPPYEPEAYIKAIRTAKAAGFEIIIIDSISHEWMGEGGCLESQLNLGGRYQDWGKITPRHNKFIGTILNCGMHVICTARTKVDYAMESGSNGKYQVRKLSTKTEQRDNTDYEFTTVLRLNQQNTWECFKDRTKLFAGNSGIINADDGKKLVEWLNQGKEIETASEKEVQQLMELVTLHDVPKDTIQKWLDKAGVSTFSEMEKKYVHACITKLMMIPSITDEDNESNQVIYVPTEANLPILEAGHRKGK